MPIYKGSTNQGVIYYGSTNTNCLTSVPKNVNLALDPLNVNIVGSPTINDGVVSGFTTANYLNLPNTFKPKDNSWEICFKVHTPSSHTDEAIFSKYTSNSYYGLRLEINGSGKIYYLVSSTSGASFLFEGVGTNTVPTNTDVLIKFQFTGTKYIGQISTDNGKTWITDKEYVSTTKMYDWDSASTIGYYAGRGLPFKGSIDLAQSYIKINNQIWWKGGTGRLTLKAGSKVYVPNGSGVFDVATVENDLKYTTWGTSVTEKALMIYNKDRNVFDPYPLRSATSGASAPTDSGLFYDTSNNKVRYYSSGSLLTDNLSLPFAVVDFQNSAATSIDQIFDWCGFIGSTAFVLPVVKGLIPNGLNTDGTYKSIELELTKVAIATNPDKIESTQQIILYNTGIKRNNTYYIQQTKPTFNENWSSLWYNPSDNRMYRYRASGNEGYVTDRIVCGSFTHSSDTKITSLTPASVQPLRTGRIITNVYKGSTLVYHLGFDPVTFTESGTWTVPAGIRKIAVDCVAASGVSSQSAGGKGGRVCLARLHAAGSGSPIFSRAVYPKRAEHPAGSRAAGKDAEEGVRLSHAGGRAKICGHAEERAFF